MYRILPSLDLLGLAQLVTLDFTYRLTWWGKGYNIDRYIHNGNSHVFGLHCKILWRNDLKFYLKVEV